MEETSLVANLLCMLKVPTSIPGFYTMRKHHLKPGEAVTVLVSAHNTEFDSQGVARLQHYNIYSGYYYPRID